MCGRYSQAAGKKELQERFGLRPEAGDVAARYNIAPTQSAPVAVRDEGLRLAFYRWGLIPYWAKDQSAGSRMINARAETLLEKPSFKRPFERSRCLVLADGFYEWKREGKSKTPMRIVRKNRKLFAMAGLWDRWRSPAGEIRSFAVVTTSPNAVMAPIHNRMPVILDREGETLWLDPKAKPRDLLALLKPCPDDALTAYRVSDLVNSPRNDVPACVEPERTLL